MRRIAVAGAACLLILGSARGSGAPTLRLRGGMPIHSLSDLKREDEAKGAGAGAGAGAMAGPVDGEKLSKDFMGMYHEKQIGGLCAVHCMNNLVQGPEFDEIEVSAPLRPNAPAAQHTECAACRSRACRLRLPAPAGRPAGALRPTDGKVRGASSPKSPRTWIDESARRSARRCRASRAMSGWTASSASRSCRARCPRARALELRCAPQGGRDACGHAHLAGACAGGRRRLHGAKVYTTAWREGLQWRRHFVAQVISEALQKRGLSCIPIGSTEAAGGKHPREFRASVCVQTRRGARSPSFHMDVHILTGRHSR